MSPYIRTNVGTLRIDAAQSTESSLMIQMLIANLVQSGGLFPNCVGRCYYGLLISPRVENMQYVKILPLTLSKQNSILLSVKCERVYICLIYSD